MNKQEKIEKRRAYDREWKRKKYAENPKKAIAKSKKAYEKMRKDPDKLEKYKEYHNRYNKKYRDTDEFREYHRKQMKEWYIKNSKKIYQQRRERPYEKLAATIRSRIYDYLKHGYKSAKSEELIGITWKELKVYLEKQFKPGMTWDNYGFYGWHVDHIIPLSSFDLTKAEEQKKAFHYTNLQPLWAKENMHKGAKYLIKFKEEQQI